ncbi:MAG: hypothetical protein JSW64_04485 [Candidatus Zixiibacteriota bacterium]|nr:MAG: hypothetical protein JSW64_04485 [candidate division Zixibacteria bacterium]
MPDETLSPSKKNEIFILITRNQLQPTMFEWEENKYRTSTLTGRIGPCNVCSVIRYKERSYFAFNFASINYDPEFSPGIKRNVEKVNGKVWSQVLELFEKWLQKIKTEVLEPDLWEELVRFRPTSDLDKFDMQSECYFNFDEIRKLQEVFKQIKDALIADFDPDELTRKRMESRFEFLVDFAKKQKIGIWRDYCIGSLIVLAMELGAGPDKIGGYWRTVAEGFAETRHFLEAGRGLPAPVA